VDIMPTFTVLTPHYNEKVCFPLAMFLLQSFHNILNYRSCFCYGRSSKSQISIPMLCSFVTQTNLNASLSAWPITSSNSLSPCSGIPSSTKKNTRMPSSCFTLIQELQIAYLEEEPHKDGGKPWLYSALIDCHSEFNLQIGQCKPKFQIKLPGNPILSDAS
jgi:1,3-beta-glucan synthase component